MKWLSLQLPKGLEVEEESATEGYSKFNIEPLERGFAVTLGNSLRRILLSSLQGAAIIAVRMEGISHEYSTIPGVVEDVSEIVLNLKEVRIKFLADKPVVVRLEKSGQGEFKAGDIDGGGNFLILNPDHHLATLNDGANVKGEIEVGFGRGYVTAGQNKKPHHPFGTILLDSVFTPVTKVNYQVHSTRVGHRVDYERLTLQLWTDGSITPGEALSYAAQIMKEHVELFITHPTRFEEVEESKVSKEVLRIRNLLKMKVEELELSVRSSNCLRAANIVTLKDLVQKTESEMLKYRNFGRKSLSELQRVLAELGLSFGMDISPYMGGEEEES